MAMNITAAAETEWEEDLSRREGRLRAEAKAILLRRQVILTKRGIRKLRTFTTTANGWVMTLVAATPIIISIIRGSTAGSMAALAAAMFGVSAAADLRVSASTDGFGA